MLLAADGRGEEAKPDDVLIQGKWKVVSMVRSGEVVRPEDNNLTHFEFAAEKLSLWGTEDGIGKPASITIKFELDASKHPRRMDTSHELDKGKPIVQLAIYALDGDELKLSLAPAGKPYPTKLDSKLGDEWSFFVLERVKND